MCGVWCVPEIIQAEHIACLLPRLYYRILQLVCVYRIFFLVGRWWWWWWWEKRWKNFECCVKKLKDFIKKKIVWYSWLRIQWWCVSKKKNQKIFIMFIESEIFRIIINFTFKFFVLFCFCYYIIKIKSFYWFSKINRSFKEKNVNWISSLNFWN